MSTAAAFFMGLGAGLATTGAFLAPVLAITGWHQSTAAGATLISGVFVAFTVTAFIANVIDRDLEAGVVEPPTRAAAPAGPLAPAH